MRAVILAGGLGTRLAEETESRPKPMVLIDDKPILWHIMKIFSQQGIDEFVLALGYKSEVVKRWLLDLNEINGDVIFDTVAKRVFHKGNKAYDDWKVHALETGLSTQTGGRIAKCMNAFPRERTLVTYGDGLANINIQKLLQFHEDHGKLATVTAVRPPARFGHMFIKDSTVEYFGEKNQADSSWINGGFFVLEPEVVEFISGDEEPFETGALPRLVEMRALMAFKHDGFWQPMDTIRERNELALLARETPPPWLRFSER
jgi:glucose-1-phosphate cytidylyltransferase